MKAIWNNTVIAETSKEDLIRIEGNWYFPPNSLKSEYFQPSSHVTSCFWKGDANYYDVAIDGDTNDFGAWYYATPQAGSIERVGQDFTNYVAFWNGITVQP